MERITLSNGVEMPMLGYGTLQITDPAQCQQCVSDAIACGYRLIDTAAAYGNEQAVGAAVRQAGVPRSELFITTKLWVQDAGYENTLKAFDISLKKLRLDYLDLYLIHQPLGDYYGAWRAMERLYGEGAARAIGVSNFSPERLVDICMNQEVASMVNQVEIHPFYQQAEALSIMKAYHVTPQAWGPLSEAQKGILRHRTLEKIAERHGRSVAQIILRWHYQRGLPTVTKTVHRARMIENLDIFDFTLTEREMASIASMDIGHSEIIDHHSFCTARQLNQIKIHA